MGVQKGGGGRGWGGARNRAKVTRVGKQRNYDYEESPHLTQFNCTAWPTIWGEI